MRSTKFLLNYPRSGLYADLLAVISVVQERRKKKGWIFGKKEEVIESIRRSYIPVEWRSKDSLSILVDLSCSLKTVFELEDPKRWRKGVGNIPWWDTELAAHRMRSLAYMRPRKEVVELWGVLHAGLFPLFKETIQVEDEVIATPERCDPLNDPMIQSVAARLDELAEKASILKDLAATVTENGLMISQKLDRILSALPPSDKRYSILSRSQSEFVSAYSNLASRLSKAWSQYDGLIRTLTSAPPLDERVHIPVYMVRTKGKVRRTFLFTQMEFRNPGVVYALKDLLGRFESVFEETSLSILLESFLDPENLNWSDNLLTEESRDGLYGELAWLQSQDVIDDEYFDAIVELISKSLTD